MGQLKSIAALEFFEDLSEPRQPGKILYPLKEILLVTLCAVIGGADSFVEIAQFGKCKLEFLKNLLPFAHGIPSHDTIGAVISSLDPKEFRKCFVAWVRAIQQDIPALIPIDGKTVRRSMNGETRPIHIVSAWATEQNLVLGQVKTNEKSNEITAIPELLDLLTIKGALVSTDAMGCQKEIAQKIVDKGGDCLLAVKGNQGTLHAEIELLFHGLDSATLPIDFEEEKVIEKGHGRIETRIYSVCSAIELLPCANDWKSLKCLGKVRSIREWDGKVSDESRYFISSRKLTAAEFGRGVRGHWGIENSLHWVMDIVFRDDECRVRTRNAAANFVTIKHIALNMLKQVKRKGSMRVKRKLAAWDDGFLNEVIGAAPEA